QGEVAEVAVDAAVVAGGDDRSGDLDVARTGARGDASGRARLDGDTGGAFETGRELLQRLSARAAVAGPQCMGARIVARTDRRIVVVQYRDRVGAGRLARRNV